MFLVLQLEDVESSECVFCCALLLAAEDGWKWYLLMIALLLSRPPPCLSVNEGKWYGSLMTTVNNRHLNKGSVCSVPRLPLFNPTLTFPFAPLCHFHTSNTTHSYLSVCLMARVASLFHHCSFFPSLCFWSLSQDQMVKFYVPVSFHILSPLQLLACVYFFLFADQRGAQIETISAACLAFIPSARVSVEKSRKTWKSRRVPGR